MIKIGTCGFSFKDWKGTAYPENIKNNEMLSYYNRKARFDTVEIDVSYYTILSQRATESWVRKTTDDFTFAVKCHKDMTLNDRGKVNPADVDNGEVFRKFLASFQPVIRSGKLLTFLAQFGPVFMKNQQNRDYLIKFRSIFGDLPLTVEFRHKSWLQDTQTEDTFDFLERNNLGYAIVDEPGLRSLAPFVPHATNDVGYFRLHGRNKRWFGGDRDQRYNYFYSDSEIGEFIPHIRMIAERTKVTSVFFNNCHAGAAFVNALRLISMLGLDRPERNDPEQMELPF
ncbi:MAG: DUF72 domain-containing protein [Candidatus Eremiobacteraeota bacterium]|nr:DUF72 domain-containing protein [Candidatus Eremiobacteraeota bacterium]